LFAVLSRDQVEKIHVATIEILQRVGVLVDDKDALQLLADAGAQVDYRKRIARIPEELVTYGLKQVPNSFTLHSRGKHQYRIGGEREFISTGGGALWMLDLKSGRHRPSTKKDVEDTSRLVDYLDNIDIYEPMTYLHDVDASMLDIQATHAVFRNTSKPCRLLTHESKYLKAIIEMAAIVSGGIDELKKNPIFVGGASPTSPLMQKSDEITVTRMLAENSIPNAIMPCPITGASSPVSVAGTLVTVNAEVISLVLIAELTNPGTPLTIGVGGPTIIDMRNAYASMGTPQAALITAGCIDIARYYGLPTWVTAFHTDSLVPDAQAGYESTWNSFFPLMDRASVMLGAGSLNAEVVASCEKLIIDNEIVSGLRSLSHGINISDKTLGLEVIESVGPGGHFLAQKHTAELFKEEQWLSKMSSRLSLQDWQNHSRDTWQMARDEALNILSTHQPEPLETGIDQQLDEYVKMKTDT